MRGVSRAGNSAARAPKRSDAERLATADYAINASLAANEPIRRRVDAKPKLDCRLKILIFLLAFAIFSIFYFASDYSAQKLDCITDCDKKENF